MTKDSDKNKQMEKLLKKYVPLLGNEVCINSSQSVLELFIKNSKKIKSMNKDQDEEQHKLLREIIVYPTALKFLMELADIQEKFPNESENNDYRTKSKIAKTLSSLPDRLAIITNPHYQYGVSFFQHNDAWLQLLSTAEGLEYDKEKGLRFKGIPMSNAELKNLFTKKGVEDINLPLLKFFYSIILKNFYDRLQVNDDGTHKTVKPTLQESITLYLPDLASQLGKSRKLSKENIKEVIAHVSAFQNIVGILKVRRNGRIYENILPVLLFMGYYDDTNTIKFSSPYLNQLIIEIFGASIAKDKNGNTIFDKKGEIKLLPSHSYLIKPSIEKCRNKAAVESVAIIVQLIEQTGNPQKGHETITAHITVENVLQRNVQLYERYKAIDDNAHKNRLLKTHFTKVYDLLKKETFLFDTYKDLTITNFIPTTSTLDNVLNFTHKGKNK